MYGIAKNNQQFHNVICTVAICYNNTVTYSKNTILTLVGHHYAAECKSFW